jgi:tetratricopeptide (TPR) repeat protein
MSFWNRLFGKENREALRPQRLDYLNEGLALERQGDFEAALTSYRLAFRDNPTDSRILLNMAIAFTKTGQPEEAIRHYKRALELDDNLVGAHYGVAFLLLKRGDAPQAAEHLRAFLARPPKGPDAERWIRHAETALRDIAGSPAPETGCGARSPGSFRCWRRAAADSTRAKRAWWASRCRCPGRTVSRWENRFS